jgi:hypothetical protein
LRLIVWRARPAWMTSLLSGTGAESAADTGETAAKGIMASRAIKCLPFMALEME